MIVAAGTIGVGKSVWINKVGENYSLLLFPLRKSAFNKIRR